MARKTEKIATVLSTLSKQKLETSEKRKYDQSRDEMASQDKFTHRGTSQCLLLY